MLFTMSPEIGESLFKVMIYCEEELDWFRRQNEIPRGILLVC